MPARSKNNALWRHNVKWQLSFIDWKKVTLPERYPPNDSAIYYIMPSIIVDCNYNEAGENVRDVNYIVE